MKLAYLFEAWIGPTSNHHIGYDEDNILKAADASQKAGDEGLAWDELLKIVNRVTSDISAGYLVRALREHGFLVQVEDRRLFILNDVPIKTGIWVRHKDLGVVRVKFERPGFDSVIIIPLGEDTRKTQVGVGVKVNRADLSGV